MHDNYTHAIWLSVRSVSRISYPIQVSPCDGKVLHFGVVRPGGYIEQVKGVTYRLDKFLGSSSLADTTITTDAQRMHTYSTQPQKCLYHIIIYLAPGDYHHFHSPADWTVCTRRHFPGK